MTNTTAQTFSAFLESLSATDYQKSSFIPARKESVDLKLAEKFGAGSDMPFVRGILMGSAEKNTIIRPFDDIDVLAIFSNSGNAWDKYRYDSQSFLYRIRNAYNGTLVQQVGARGQAIRVFYQSGGHVDIAPVFDAGNNEYKLPAGDGTWISTSPTIASGWFAGRNTDLSYNLAPVVRLAKSWNRAHSRRFRSFHLETVAGAAFSQLGTNYRDALHKFFQWAPNYLDVSDPGGQSGTLSSYLTWPARTDLKTALDAAADRAGRAITAESQGDHAEAKRLWRINLGADFPTI